MEQEKTLKFQFLQNEVFCTAVQPSKKDLETKQHQLEEKYQKRVQFVKTMVYTPFICECTD